MKIKVQIDSVFQEEMLQIQAPSRTPKIQEKKMAKLILSSLMLFPEFTSKIVKF